jgi:hypothetical protein
MKLGREYPKAQRPGAKRASESRPCGGLTRFFRQDLQHSFDRIYKIYKMPSCILLIMFILSTFFAHRKAAARSASSGSIAAVHSGGGNSFTERIRTPF